MSTMGTFACCQSRLILSSLADIFGKSVQADDVKGNDNLISIKLLNKEMLRYFSTAYFGARLTGFLFGLTSSRKT